MHGPRNGRERETPRDWVLVGVTRLSKQLSGAQGLARASLVVRLPVTQWGHDSSDTAPRPDARWTRPTGAVCTCTPHGLSLTRPWAPPPPSTDPATSPSREGRSGAPARASPRVSLRFKCAALPECSLRNTARENQRPTTSKSLHSDVGSEGEKAHGSGRDEL